MWGLLWVMGGRVCGGVRWCEPGEFFARLGDFVGLGVRGAIVGGIEERGVVVSGLLGVAGLGMNAGEEQGRA